MFKKQIPVKQAGCLKGAFHEIIRKHNILKSNKIITTCIIIVYKLKPIIKIFDNVCHIFTSFTNENEKRYSLNIQTSYSNITIYLKMCVAWVGGYKTCVQ